MRDRRFFLLFRNILLSLTCLNTGLRTSPHHTHRGWPLDPPTSAERSSPASVSGLVGKHLIERNLLRMSRSGSTPPSPSPSSSDPGTSVIIKSPAVSGIWHHHGEISWTWWHIPVFLEASKPKIIFEECPTASASETASPPDRVKVWIVVAVDKPSSTSTSTERWKIWIVTERHKVWSSSGASSSASDGDTVRVIIIVQVRTSSASASASERKTVCIFLTRTDIRPSWASSTCWV